MTTDPKPSRFMHAVERVSGGEHPHNSSARLFVDELDDHLADGSETGPRSSSRTGVLEVSLPDAGTLLSLGLGS